MQEKLYKTENGEEYEKLGRAIYSGLIDLKIRYNTPDENEMMKKANEVVGTVEKILYSNDLKQKGQGLKIITPQQMLSRIPISLAQLKAGNNSQEPKNEMRQLLYSIHR